MLILLLAACDLILPWAETVPAPQVEQAEVIIPAADEPWMHPWRSAAIVIVDPAAASPRDLAGQSEAERVDLGLDEAILRDAMAHRPVGVWMAAPGTAVHIVDQKPESTEGPLVWTVPAEAGAGDRYVVTEGGAHRLAWDSTSAVREAEVALGFMPWRVIVEVGQPSPTTPQDQGPLRGDVIQGRLRENGILLLSVAAPERLPVPWSDAPLEWLDLPAILGDRTAGYVLAERGRTPWLVGDGAPDLVLSDASTYFEAELGRPGGARAGARTTGQRVGKAGRTGDGKAGKTGPGKVGKLAGGKTGKLAGGKAGKVGKVGKVGDGASAEAP